MNYLLDTHTLIWFLNGDPDLSSKSRKAIEAETSSIFVSIASVWEIAIKVSLDRLDLKISFERLREEIESNGFKLLPITFDDIMILSELPMIHRDPFDRIIISQALSNNFILISRDKAFKTYQVKLLW